MTKYKIRFSRNWLYLFICPLITSTGLVTILKVSDYAVFSFESLAAFLFFTILGIIVGLAITLADQKTEIFLISFLISLLCNLLFWPFPYLSWVPLGIWGAPLLILLVTIVVVVFMGSNRPLYLVAVSAAFFLGAFLVGPTSQQWKTEKFELSVTNRADLPPYIHIVLDGHTGLDGMLNEFEESDDLFKMITQSYEQLGFRLFSRANSRYKLTVDSFSSFMNFRPQASPDLMNYSGIKYNTLFESLSRRGYSINVFQSGYLNLCQEFESSFSLASCYTYPFSQLLENLKHSSLSGASKAIVIITTVLQRAGFLSMVNKLSNYKLAVAIGIPEWPIRVCMGCLASQTTLADFEVGIKNIQPGQAYFLHLLWPHGPHQNYTSDCKPDFSMRFESASFQNRYSRYLTQTACTQHHVLNVIRKIINMGNTQGVTIVVHGDHGTRVHSTPGEVIDPNTVKSMQAFSTFFAVRSGGYHPGVDRRPAPLDILLGELHQWSSWEQGEIENNQVMFPQGWDTFHPFSGGELSSEW